MYPTDVEVNEDKILKLTKTLQSAYKEIVAEIEDATDFGVYNRQVILAQVDKRLTELGVDIDAFIREELPQYYKRGADDAIKQLRKQGAPIETAYGFNRVHIEAIEALIDDTAKAFGESLSGISRSANNLLGKATRELITQQMAKGMVGGDALKTTKDMIKGLLKEQGLEALVDKGGHRWTLDRYSEMLLRTKAVEARNRGLINRVAENGYDLVQVSHHFTNCDLCAPWEGKILSIGGETRGYPSLEKAESEGLFHPNCKHAINTLIPELAGLTNAYDDTTKTYVVPQSTAVDMAKMAGGASPTEVKFGKFTAQLDEWQKKLADKYELNFQPKVLGKTTRGAYEAVGSKRTINVNEDLLSKWDEDQQESVFKWVWNHEFGHFVDDVVGNEKAQYQLFREASSEWKAAVRSRATIEKITGDKVSISERSVIGRRRLLHGAEHTHDKEARGIWDTFSAQDKEDFLMGKVFPIGDPYDDGKGRVIQKRYGLGEKYIKYIYSEEEVFAESVSWFQNDPDGLKDAAPNVFEVISNLIKGV